MGVLPVCTGEEDMTEGHFFLKWDGEEAVNFQLVLVYLTLLKIATHHSIKCLKRGHVEAGEGLSMHGETHRYQHLESCRDKCLKMLIWTNGNCEAKVFFFHNF